MPTLLQMLMDNPRGWGNGPAPQEVAWQDDAGNLYGFDNKVLSKGAFPEQPQSWGETALNTVTSPARIAGMAAESLMPYAWPEQTATPMNRAGAGSPIQGGSADPGWRMPPMLTELGSAISAPGRAYSEGMSPEEMQRTAASAAGFAMGGGGLAAGRAPMVAANASKEAGALGLANALEAPAPIRAYRGATSPDDLISGRSLFASSATDVADSYANLAMYPDDARAFDGGAVMPVDMNFKNPLVFDAKGSRWSNIPDGDTFTTTDHLFQRAKQRGHDGLVVKNVIDNLTARDAPPANTYAAIARNTVTSPLTGETLFANSSKEAGAVGMANALNGTPQRGYHGTTYDVKGKFVPSDDGLLGPGVYSSPVPDGANIFAGRNTGSLANPRMDYENGSVYPFDISGPIASESDWMRVLSGIDGSGPRVDQARSTAIAAQNALEKEGFKSVQSGGTTNTFRPGNITSPLTGETLFANSSKEAGALGMLAPYLEKEQKKRGGK